jgi:hypothetical protein
MTVTLQPMANEVDPQQLAEQLSAQAKAQGVDLVGPNGLLNQLTQEPAGGGMPLEQAGTRLSCSDIGRLDIGPKRRM